MRTIGNTIIHEEASPRERATAVRACLDYLYAEAISAGLGMGAHLIGAASAAIEEEINRKDL